MSRLQGIVIGALFACGLAVLADGFSPQFISSVSAVFSQSATVTGDGGVVTPKLRVTVGGLAGRVLTSDDAGNATWKAPAAAGLTQSQANLLYLRTDGGTVVGSVTVDGGFNVGGATLLNGNVTLGDSPGDSVTSNAATWSLPNDTNFSCAGGVNGFSIDGTTFSVDCLNNRVGLGTAVPSGDLEIASTTSAYVVAQTSSASGYAQMRVHNDGVGASGHFISWGSAVAGTALGLAAANAVNFYADGPSISNFVLGTQTATPMTFSTNAIPRMTMLSSGEVGIGDQTPASLFTVGAGKFQVNGTGNLVKLNNVTVSAPASQGAANTFLANDGSGNWTWASAGAHYEATGNGNTLLDTAYFATGTPVTRYVNPSTGSDTLCDGKASTASPTLPCAWATVQRALDDIPNGYTVNVDINLPAGTFSGTQIWLHHAVMGSAGSANPIVRIRADCTTATAVLTSTTAALNVTTAGSGKTGGVTQIANVLYSAPTVVSGSITGVTDGSHYLSTALSAGVAPTVIGVRASTAPDLLLVTTTTTAFSNRRLCEYASGTVFSGSITVGSIVGATRPANSLVVVGISFTGTLSASQVQLVGVKVAGASSTINNSVIQTSVFTNQASLVNNSPLRLAPTGTLFMKGAEMSGQWGNVSNNVFVGGGSTNCLWVNAGVAVPSTNEVSFGGMTLTRNDFEGTCTGIRASSSILGGLNAGANVIDITGPFIDLEDGSYFVTQNTNGNVGNGSGTVSGKRTAANIVKSGSHLTTNSLWVDTNVTSAGQDVIVGAQAVTSYANLPVTDYASGSTASIAGVGPTAVPIIQGGTGYTTATPDTLTSIALSGTLAAATIGKVALPARAFTVTSPRVDVSVAGSTGSTNVVLRVTDGTNTCDGTFACNATAGAKRPTLVNSGGTGCVFPASAVLTISVNSIGDCVTPPVILGPLDLEGNWP